MRLKSGGLRIALCMLSLVLLPRCAQNQSRALQPAASSADLDVIAYVPAKEISLAELERAELQTANPLAVKALETADALVRRNVQYRHDDKDHALTRAQLTSFQPRLSCSEFVWYVLSLAGEDLGNRHLETRQMAYNAQVYSPALERVDRGGAIDEAAIRPGDVLVYEYSLSELKREEKLTGKYRSGHAVMVVSARDKIVVGSHFRESSPGNMPTGAGYRRLLKGWKHWTSNRTLKAVYRIRNVEGGK